MKNLKTELRIQGIEGEKSKLNNELKKISTKHRILAEQIFYPLYQNIIEIKTGEKKLPEIKFTGSQIRDSLHYEEGLNHLQCIPDFLSHFELIENKINMYNLDVYKLYDDRLENYVLSYIQENGFRLSTDSEYNTLIPINLSNLLPALILYWHGDKPNIEFTESKGSLKIVSGMGHAEIAIINNDNDEIRVKNLVDELKNLDDIKRELDKFYNVVIDIYNLTEKLSKDIGKNIIRYIELNEYDDICEICKGSKSS